MEDNFKVSKDDKKVIQGSSAAGSVLGKSSMQFMSLSSYAKPIYSEGYSRNPWINWGENNLLPYYYIDLYKNSPTNGQAINSKTRFTAGQGFILGDDPFLNYINEDDENANDVLAMAAFDLNLYGCFSLNVIWSNDRKTIASISHIDSCLLRSGKCGPDGKIREYYFSNDWSLAGQRKPENKPMRYCAFDANNREEASQILWFRRKRPGCLYYTYPDWEDGTSSVEEEIECINFHLNNVRNGFSPSFSINFSNTPGPEEQDSIYRDFQKKYKSTENVGKIVMTFSDPGNAPVITPLTSNDSDKKYEKQQENARQNILISHAITSPMLFGILQPGMLGGRKEIAEAAELFQNLVIAELQDILERQFNKLFKYANVTEFKEIIPFKIINPIDLSISEASLLQVLSRDEVREMIGIKAEEPKPQTDVPVGEQPGAKPIEEEPIAPEPVLASKEVSTGELRKMIEKQLNNV